MLKSYDISANIVQYVPLHDDVNKKRCKQNGGIMTVSLVPYSATVCHYACPT